MDVVSDEEDDDAVLGRADGEYDGLALGLTLGWEDSSTLGDPDGYMDATAKGEDDVVVLGLVDGIVDGLALGITLGCPDGCTYVVIDGSLER